MAYDVFVSYSSKDKPAADATCAALESKGIRCWIAPRDILPGADWGESIIDAIHGSRAMVLVFSANANLSPQIKREVERAVNAGMPVIPLRIENVVPTKALEYFLSSPHWLDAFTPPLERHLDYLADVIRHILNGETSPAAPDGRLAPGSGGPHTPATAGSARSWTFPMTAAAAAVAIVAVVASGIFWVERGREPIAPPVKAPVAAPSAPTPPPPPAAAPPTSAPSSLDAETAERMRRYVGLTVHGISTVTGKPFVMTLGAGGVADVKVELAIGGQYIFDHGSWWIASNGSFCVHYTRFASGNQVCRALVVEDGVTKAYTWDHKPNPWVFKK